MLARTPSTFAVFASGAGSNFEALAVASREPGFPGAIALLVSDEPGAPALDRARRLGVPTLVLSGGRYRTRIEDERRWVEAIASRGVDAVLLAGFMRRLHDGVLGAFPDRILNVHPSLLPAFPGRDAIRRAWDHGVRATGVTVHVVNGEVDAGPIV
ncbi:MAG TPA: phosphoribosylglycinamide formyltransferase, partial [Solirubrobacteraceae bacterium]